MFRTVFEDVVPGFCLVPHVSSFTSLFPNSKLPEILTVWADFLYC